MRSMLSRPESPALAALLVLALTIPLGFLLFPDAWGNITDRFRRVLIRTTDIDETRKHISGDGKKARNLTDDGTSGADEDRLTDPALQGAGDGGQQSADQEGGESFENDERSERQVSDGGAEAQSDGAEDDLSSRRAEEPGVSGTDQADIAEQELGEGDRFDFEDVDHTAVEAMTAEEKKRLHATHLEILEIVNRVRAARDGR